MDTIVYLPSQTSLKSSSSSTHEFEEDIYNLPSRATENSSNDYLPSSCSGENDDNLVVFSSPPTLTPPSPFIEVDKSNSSSKNEKKSRKKNVKTTVEVLPQITEENNNIFPKIRSTSQKKTHIPSQATEKPYKFDGGIITEIKNEYLEQIINLPSHATTNLGSPLCPDKKMKNSPDLILPPCPLVSLKENTSNFSTLRFEKLIFDSGDASAKNVNLPSQATENPYNVVSSPTSLHILAEASPESKRMSKGVEKEKSLNHFDNLPSQTTANSFSTEQSVYEKINPSSLCFDEKMNNESKNIDRMLEREKEHNKTENWNKLDKTAKMQKLATYSEKYGKDNNLTAKEINQLKIFFNESLDKSKLQKSKDVIYNKESKEITSVPSLYLNTNTHNFSFKITDSKRVSTIKSLTPKRINILEESN